MSERRTPRIPVVRVVLEDDQTTGLALWDEFTPKLSITTRESAHLLPTRSEREKREWERTRAVHQIDL